ncbi:MAG: GDSL family lipase [Bryobacteraceae bacterium]|nr:GDSL family lipase [Bryobacteraceae bacterium]
MEWYEPDVRDLEVAAHRQQLPACPAVLYGSSSMRLWTTFSRDLRSVNIVNRAFGGSTLAACVHYFDRLIPGVHPCSLILYAGDNDLGDGRSPADVLASFDAFLNKMEAFKLGKIPFAFISIKPSPARASILDNIRNVNHAVQRQLEQRPNSYFINTFDAMLDREGRVRPELFLEDGLHMSRAGYAIWIDHINPYRNQLFMETQQVSYDGPLLLKESEQGLRQVVQPRPEP